MNENIEKLKEIIKEGNVLFFGGAGGSVPSGIPDFRSSEGLYEKEKMKNPEYLLSKTCFRTTPEKFYAFYKQAFDLRKYEPNIVHKRLAEWEEKGYLKCIITQNVDGLHEKSGSKNIINYHGSIYSNTCVSCKKKYPVDTIFDNDNEIPRCECGGMIRPDIVLYEEAIPMDVQIATSKIIKHTNTLIVAGTSLSVYPASTIVSDCYAKNLVIINKDKTHSDSYADIVIHDDIAEVFEQLIIE